MLTDLYRKATNAGVWEEYDLGTMSFDGATCYLPESVIKWAGLENDSPGTCLDNLVELNDGGALFEQIADTIEGVED